MNAAFRKVGLGLCIASVLLGLVAVGSFWFTPATDSVGVGETHDEFVATINDSLRESPTVGHALYKTRAEMHRESAVFGLIISSILFVSGSILYLKSRKSTP